MRAVTFSNKKVADQINKRFIPVWYNRGPGFHNCSLWTEKRIFTQNADCYPTKNICTFFLTPDRQVVYYVAGYYGPDTFLEILKDVDGLKAAKTAGQKKRAHELHVESIKTRIEKVKSEVGDLNHVVGNQSFTYGMLRHVHQAPCVSVLQEYLYYRKLVHYELAWHGGLLFKDVQHRYISGNSFSEEAWPMKQVPTLVRPQTPEVSVATGTE